MRTCRHCDEKIILSDGVWVLLSGETPEVCVVHKLDLVTKYHTFYSGLDSEAVHEPY